jgi:hypothetical protein
MTTTVIATFPSHSVPSGTFTSPAGVVPSDAIGLQLRMSRGNWPAAGANIALLVSFDSGVTYPTVYANDIAAWVDDGNPKHGLSDAVIGFGWGEGQPIPDHVKARSISGTAYVSTITVEKVTP